MRAYRIELLKEEVRRLTDLGVEVPGSFSEFDQQETPELVDDFQTLTQLPIPVEAEAKEPLGWTIPTSIPTFPIDDVKARIAAAWKGRIAGCLLGKPLELGIVFNQWQPLVDFLKESGQWPLRFYVEANPEIAKRTLGSELGCKPSWRENLQFAETDDDLRYTYCGLQTLDRHGENFQTHHVAAWWTENLTMSQLFTAEQAVIANLYQLGQPQWWTLSNLTEAEWEWVRNHDNPYREWIGAAIRADGWGYAFAGQPYRAAIAAQKDARLSHDRNGEYSEIFFAALISAAFGGDLEPALDAALQTIPSESRLADAFSRTRDFVRDHPGEDVAFLEWAHAEFGHLHGIHAINNAVVCLGAILLFPHDFAAAVGTAVMAGWDPDCNGATVGSIWGALNGAIPSEWTDPLHDELRLAIPSCASIKISELVRWTCEIHARLARG